MKEYQMYINGQWCDASDGKTVEVINPANEEVIAQVPMGTTEDAERAIKAAKDSFESGVWRDKDPADRSRIMLDVFKEFQARAQEFATLETQNCGIPLGQCALTMVASALNRFQWFSKAANRIFEEPMPLYRAPAAAFPYIRREPIGVCAQIVPWNAPLSLGTGLLAAPLATGNSVVIKPSILTPCTLLELAKIIDESEIRKGVVNVVVGTGEGVGEVMASHPFVDKVSFTGSTGTGKRVLSLAAKTVKTVTMELGGKSAIIFLDDTDIDLAVGAAVWGCFLNAGQICYATTRALVPANMYDAFVEKLVEKVKKISVGDPMDAQTTMGPLVSEDQRKRVEAYIAIGQKEGAALACGGGRPRGLEKGFFIEPAVFTHVDNGMRIAQEEIFGPVLCVIKYDGDEEAVRIANDSKYGLLGAVFSKNIERAIAIAEKLRAGNVWINEVHLMSLDLPYGGSKQSGIGRERGLQGLINDYTEIKSIQIDLGHSLSQRYWYDLIVPR
jgi:acyl-CoA reductase-like NAD-dependent aldehyde dehydrogenase